MTDGNNAQAGSRRAKEELIALGYREDAIIAAYKKRSEEQAVFEWLAGRAELKVSFAGIENAWYESQKELQELEQKYGTEVKDRTFSPEIDELTSDN